MKIPFTLYAWLKDKSQRVETRDGRIVHNIWRVKEPFYANNRKAEVCALIDGEEDALVFFEGGRYIPTTQDTDSHFDLFIITPEPELSEFELALRNAMSDTIVLAEEKDDDETSKIADKQAKRYAAELLSIARKEFVEEQYTSDPRKTDLYKLGKAEALKDLPRWKTIKKEDNAIVRIPHVGTNILGERMLYIGENAISISCLMKLPGFKEDSHE